MIFQRDVPRSTITPRIILELYFHDSFLFKEKRNCSSLKEGVGESLAHPSRVLMEVLTDPAWTEMGHFLHKRKSLALLPMNRSALST